MERKLKPSLFPDETDIGLACDGDLNTIWETSNKEKGQTSRERFTIGQTIAAHQRQLNGEDSPLPLAN